MHYLDTSALVKFVVRESESAALLRWARTHSLASSDLARTELVRAVRRVDPAAVTAAREVLASVHLIRLTPDVLDAAARLAPDTLRSLDAIHLSSALALGDDLESFVTYDDRQAEAAQLRGVVVYKPR
jgi:predicted nucleic acid-binding protein